VSDTVAGSLLGDGIGKVLGDYLWTLHASRLNPENAAGVHAFAAFVSGVDTFGEHGVGLQNVVDAVYILNVAHLRRHSGIGFWRLLL
jgi:hypothetical protein